MGSASASLGEELLAQQLHSFAPATIPQAGTAAHPPTSTPADPPALPNEHPRTNAGPGSPDTTAHQSLAAHQTKNAPAAAADDMSERDVHSQPVSFQSLAALASSHAAKAKQDFDRSRAANTAGPAEQARPQAPSTTAPSGEESDRAVTGEGSVPEGSANPPGVPHSSPATGEKLGSAAEQARATSNRPAVLGRPLSEKKWAYPMPTGSPMFERVRSRNHDQGPLPASPTDNSHLWLPHDQANAAGATVQEQQHPASADRLNTLLLMMHTCCVSFLGRVCASTCFGWHKDVRRQHDVQPYCQSLCGYTKFELCCCLRGCQWSAFVKSLSQLCACRSDDFPQQPASSTAAPAEAIVYEAPPTGPAPQVGGSAEAASHDVMMAHHQTGNIDHAATKGNSGTKDSGSPPAAQSASSPSVQRSTLPDEAASSSTASAKGWWATDEILLPVSCLVPYHTEHSPDGWWCKMALTFKPTLHISVICALLLS